MSQTVVQLLLALLSASEPVIKQAIAGFLQSLDASATNATEKLFIEAVLKLVAP